MIVSKLKKSILISAFKGELSKRDKNDTSIDSLIDLIKDEKIKLIEQGKILKQKPLKKITEDEIPFSIPNEWKWVRWGELSNSIQYGLGAGAQPKGKAKLVRISDIQDNEIKWDSVPYCDASEKDIKQYLLNENDILFARTGGTVGKSVIVKDIPTDVPYVFAGYLIRSNYSSKMNYKYLKFFMESTLYWDQLRKGTIGSAQPNCNGQTLSNMILPLPPIEEQERIVDKISLIFDKLNDLEPIENELNLLKMEFPRRFKKSILQDYMHINDSFEKYSYDRMYLKDLVNITTGKKDANYGSADGKYYFFTCSKEPIRCDNYSFDCESILLAGNGNIGNINYYNGKFEAYQRTYVLQKSSNKINLKYLYYHLLANWEEYNNYQIFGTAIPYIKLGNVQNYVVNCPPLEEQQKIVDKIEQLLPLLNDIDNLVNK